MKNKKFYELTGFIDISENENELTMVNAGCADDVFPIPNNYHPVDYFNPLTVKNYYDHQAASSAAGTNSSYGFAPSQESKNKNYQKQQGYGPYKNR